jgi:hypothetical protein
MIEPQAARLDLHDPPRLSHQCLKELRYLLDVVLSVNDERETTSADRDGESAS